MARLSKIDRLPPEVKAKIASLRDNGRTVDEIMAALNALDLPDEAMPSRATVGRHIQRIDALGAKLRAIRDKADALTDDIGDGAAIKQAQINIRLMQEVMERMLVAATDDEGEAGKTSISPKDAMMISVALNSTIRSSSAANQAIKGRQEIERERDERAAKLLDTAVTAAAGAGEKGLSLERIQQLRRDIAGVGG